MVLLAIEDKDFQALYYITYKKMALWEPDEIDFEDQYEKADPIDDNSLDESINELNRSIREQEELQEKLSRAEWSPINKDEIAKLGQQIAFNEKKQGLYIMRASKTILLILHRGFNKIKQGGRVMVSDEKSAEKLYRRLRLVESDEGTYKVAFENGALKDILSPGNRWLAPNAYLRIFVRNSLRIWVLMWINLKVVQKVRYPER